MVIRFLKKNKLFFVYFLEFIEYFIYASNLTMPTSSLAVPVEIENS